MCVYVYAYVYMCVYTRVTYVYIGVGCQVAKADLKDAFRIIPVCPLDYHLLGFTFQTKFYFDMCLPMGCSVSCQIFEALSCALQWICINKFRVSSMSHILDDFIFFGPPHSGQYQFNLDAFFNLLSFYQLSSETRQDCAADFRSYTPWHCGRYLCADINSAYGQADPPPRYNAYTSCLGGKKRFACLISYRLSAP